MRYQIHNYSRAYLIRLLKAWGACDDALDWIRTQPATAKLRDLVNTCTDPWWMLWAIRRLYTHKLIDFDAYLPFDRIADDLWLARDEIALAANENEITEQEADVEFNALADRIVTRLRDLLLPRIKED